MTLFRYLSEVFVTDESFSENGGGTTVACPDGIICIAVLIIIVINVIIIIVVVFIIVIVVSMSLLNCIMTSIIAIDNRQCTFL